MTPAPDRQSEQDAGARLGVHWAATRPVGMALLGVGALPNARYPAHGTPYSQPPGSPFHLAPAQRRQAQPGRRIVTFAIGADTACDGRIDGAGQEVSIVGYGRFFLPVRMRGAGLHAEFLDSLPALQPRVAPPSMPPMPPP